MDEQSKQQQVRKFRFRAKTLKTAKDIGVVVGVLAGVFSVVKPLQELAEHQKQIATQQKAAEEQAEQSNRVLKVTSLTGMVQVLDRDTEIKGKIAHFLDQFDTAEKVMEKAKTFPSGNKAYRSLEFSDLNAVGHYYEMLGALTKSKYVDLDLIYTIIDFPFAFWDRTSRFRDMVCKENWDGPGAPLPDFWENFRWLHDEYEKKRKQRVSPSAQ